MSINQNIRHFKDLIAHTLQESQRTADSVLLLAVSKQQSVSSIIEAHQAGIHDFGENYLQEALLKMHQLKQYPICWHFIGPIQRNKTKTIAQSFDWVHSINRGQIALDLNKHRPCDAQPLHVCLQINLVAEETKSGIAPEEAAELALLVSQQPQLKLRGLMTIPPPEKDPNKLYHLFNQLNVLMQRLNAELGLSMDTLSMGMSDDIVPALQAGATIVRVGRGIFGERSQALK